MMIFKIIEIKVCQKFPAIRTVYNYNYVNHRRFYLSSIKIPLNPKIDPMCITPLYDSKICF